MINNKRERPKWPMQRLKGMCFAMHCWKCKKFELPSEEYKKICENNIQKIIDNIFKCCYPQTPNEFNATFCTEWNQENADRYSKCTTYSNG